MDASLRQACVVFNFLEAILWLSVAAGFALAFYRRRGNPNLTLAAGLLFLAFGISDFVEMRTGAWYKPWWLFAWKAATLVGLAVVFVLYWRRGTARLTSPLSSTASAAQADEGSSAAGCRSAFAALRLPVPSWVTAVWRTACLALLATGGVLLCVPVARVDREHCARIQAGMSVAEAEKIVGAPTGWYDGVRQIRSDAPARRGDRPGWVGSGGEILLDLDAEGRVAKATFYPGEALDRPLIDFLAERLVFRWFRWQ